MIKNKAELFNLSKNINDYILEKYNEDYSKLNFLDFFVFQLTSYTCALIYRRLYLDKTKLSIDSLFIYRSMMENIASIYKYMKDGITPEEEELLREYSLIVEKAIYNRYKCEFGDIYKYDDMLSNYNTAKANYRIVMADINYHDFEKILNLSKLPFFKEKIDFHHLIKDYFPQQFANYGLLSVFLHPHDLLCSHTDIIKRYNISLKDNWIANLDDDILSRVAYILENVYPDSKDIILTKTLKSECELIAERDDNPNYLFMDIVKQQRNILYSIADEIEKIAENDFKVYFLREIGDAIVAISIYHIFGMTEVVKSVYKPIVELLALDDYVFSTAGLVDNPKLLEANHYHTIYNLCKLCYEEDKLDQLESYIKKTYELMNKSIEKRSYDEFKRTFYKPLSFINNNPYLNEFVRNYFNKILNDKRQNSSANLLYDEAQLLSHGNGYLLGSNEGAFMDDEPVITTVDALAFLSLKKFSVVALVNSITVETDDYASLLNIINTKIDDFRELIDSKRKLMDLMRKYKVKH